MPGGLGAIGFLAFGGVKLGGYTGASAVLNRYLPGQLEKPGNLKVGAIRTGIGLIAGASYGLTIALTADSIKSGTVRVALFFGLLIPLRLLEWLILLRIYFWDALGRKVPWKWMALGTGWSFVLDAIAIGCAFVVPGGIWIC